jgi:hypothetical protein
MGIVVKKKVVIFRGLCRTSRECTSSVRLVVVRSVYRCYNKEEMGY